MRNLFLSSNREKLARRESERLSSLFAIEKDDKKDSASSSSSARPSPNLHHRVVGGGAFLLGAEGARGSLENLKQQYSMETGDDKQRLNPAYKGDLIGKLNYNHKPAN